MYAARLRELAVKERGLANGDLPEKSTTERALRVEAKYRILAAGLLACLLDSVAVVSQASLLIGLV